MAKEEVKPAEEQEVTTEEVIAKVEPTEAVAVDEKTTKAGKHSAKAIREAEEQAEKEARKEAGDTTPQGEAAAAEKKGAKPKVRPLVERRGKNYRNVVKQIEVGQLYGLAEALELAAKTSVGQFDGTIEVHVNLGVDPRQADQNIRNTVSLPNGTGKTIRVAVFAPADQHEAAKKAGADIAGEEDFLQQLEKGELNFDVLISTPQMMPKLGKYARVLGPRGLMPNPKSGTVAADVTKAVTAAKAGRVEYRVDKQSIVHLGIGKASFGGEKLLANAKAFFESLNSVKPTTLKNAYIKSVSVASTMGPGVKVDLSGL